MAKIEGDKSSEGSELGLPPERKSVVRTHQVRRPGGAM
jgi:hypothetical protein